MQTILVAVPPNAQAGQRMAVPLPGGGTAMVTIPAGCRPGTQIKMQVPRHLASRAAAQQRAVAQQRQRRPVNSGAAIGGGGGAAEIEWDCPTCTFKNPGNVLACKMCGSEKPGGSRQTQQMLQQHQAEMLRQVTRESANMAGVGGGRSGGGGGGQQQRQRADAMPRGDDNRAREDQAWRLSVPRPLSPSPGLAFRFWLRCTPAAKSSNAG